MRFRNAVNNKRAQFLVPFNLANIGTFGQFLFSLSKYQVEEDDEVPRKEGRKTGRDGCRRREEGKVGWG